MHNKTIIIFIFLLGTAVLAIGGFYLFGTRNMATVSRNQGGKVITENLMLPDTTSVSAVEGSIVAQDSVAVPLMPKSDSEKIIVPNAVLTVRGVVALTEPEVKKWSSDAKLVFIKSLGAITLEGKSSQWQAIFDSRKIKKGYEIVVRGGAIISQKEINSTATGAALPIHWSDSDEAIRTLQGLPQFAGATVSALTFFYNTDAQEWRYGLATSEGTTSMNVK